ncbi:MAG: Mini-ribonuclease 3 [Eubacteriales bacterium]
MKENDSANTVFSGMTVSEVSAVSAANLAYLGDCVYELLVREYLVRQGSTHPSVDALSYVTARVQSGVVEKLLPHLTEEEADVYRRGRNIGHSNIPKSSTVSEYRRATGLETLFGWLHLTGQSARLRELFALAFAEAE